jgi:hypothetical protein
MPNFAVINDEAVAVAIDEKPTAFRGIQRIIGKSTPHDRKFVMKTDPTLVIEKINGKETENLGRRPILVYDIATPSWARNFESLVTNGGFFVLGAIVVAMLYYWKIIEVFTK